MAVDVVGGWAYTEIAALLEEIGTFPTLQAAYEAVARNPYHYLEFAKYMTETQNPINVGVLKVATGGAPAPVISPTATPLDLARVTDMTAAPTKVKTISIGFKEIPPATPGGSPTYGPTALMGVELGTVGAVCAPLLGVALGISWYEQNPDLWTKLSQKLLPFCYPDTTIIPTWAEIADSAWKVSLAKGILDAIKDLFDEEGIGELPDAGDTDYGDFYGYSNGSAVLTSAGGAFHDVITINSNSPIAVYATGSNATSIRVYSANSQIYVNIKNYRGSSLVSERNVSGSTVYVDGRPGYYAVGFNSYGVPSGANLSPVIPVSEEVIRALRAGGTPAGGWPPGTEPWTGTLYDPVPAASPAVIGQDPSTGTPITQPMIPISLPIPAPKKDPSPQPSPDPEEQPDPTETTDPEEQVEPYILPLPVPEEETDPTIPPEPDPEEDPSQPKDPPQKIVDIIPLPPPSGVSPWPSMPTTPSWFSSNVGLVTVYHPTPAQFYAFSQWLWVTLSEATIETVWNNPFDGVITAFELYCTPTDNGYRNIHSGFLDSGINSATISRYTEINCGTIAIPEYYGTYFDYSPYSKAHVYLPFIGIQELNVDDIVGHAVNITYRIDEYNGACIAMITVAKVTNVNGDIVEYSDTMYQFAGNCSVELPMAGGSQAQIKAGLMMADATRQAALIGAGADLLGGLGSLLNLNLGGLLGGLGSAAYTLAQGEVSALGHMLSGKATVQKSGSFGTSHGALGIKTPFIVVTRPKQITVANYNELYGYPAHKMVTVGACTGFIRCREIHVYSPTATDEEKTMIETLFKSGVYITE